VEVTVRIPCGGIDLVGRVLLPRSPELAVVLCHPHPLLGGDMHSLPLEWMKDALAARGAAVLRFNFRGTGGSGGTHDGGRDERQDVAAAVRFMQERTRGAPVALAGYSFGAAVAALASRNLTDVLGLGLVAPPLSNDPLPELTAADFPSGILLVSGDADDFCSEPAARAWAVRSGANAVILPGVDHFFGVPGARQRLVEAIRDWPRLPQQAA
jgi:alpha/beta superfamily hydrolase